MNINQLKAGVLLTYLSMGIGTLISILYTPFMLRILGQSEYGLYTLVSSVVSYLGLLSFGFGSAYMRYYAIERTKQDRQGVARLNGMFLSIFIILGIIALVCGLILTGFSEQIFRGGLTDAEIAKTKILMLLLVINIALSFPFNLFTAYINANERYIFLKLVGVLKTILNPFLMLPVLLAGWQSVGMVCVTVILNLTVELIYLVYCIKKLHMRFVFHGFHFSMLKELWIFSSFIFLNMITDQINWGVDKFILGIVKGSSAVAVYGIAAQLNSYYLQFSSAVSSVFIPRVNHIVHNGSHEELTDLFTRVGRIQFIVLSLILTGMIFFGRAFIQFWAGVGYSDSYAAALFLIIPVTIPSVQNLGIEIQRARNQHKFRSILYFCIALGNILLSVPLSIRYGPKGAAAGTALALLLGNGIAMNVYYHKAMGLNMLYFWRQLLGFVPALIPPCVLGLMLMLFAPLTQFSVFLASGIVYVVLFSVSMWKLGMSPQEKDIVRKPLTAIIEKYKNRR